MTAPKLRLTRHAAGLSARLLLLTIAFVMLAEVLIYAPSIARFRLAYLQERLSSAHLAILTLDATPDQMVSAELGGELLAHVGAHGIALTRPGRGKMMLEFEPPPQPLVTADLRESSFFELIGEAFGTLLAEQPRWLRVVGPSPKNAEVLAEVILPEAPLRAEMVAYSQRILLLSLVISLFTAALVYLSLHWLMVRPLLRITDNMLAFSGDPEDETRIIGPSSRSDEVGLLQSRLSEMQAALRAALQHKTRLAGIGTAVTKINHDLKNILATALLLSDRLQQSDDPEARRVTPRLTEAIERAIKICEQTLTFTREGPVHLERSRFELSALVAEVGEGLPPREPEEGEEPPVFENALDGPLEVLADREQLFRVLSNLTQNAFEAGAHRVRISARSFADQGKEQVEIKVEDDGPGLAPRARERLFQPFAGSARPGGTGLGLAIARELMRAHGGDIRLERSTGEGSVFLLDLPLPREEAVSAKVRPLRPVSSDPEDRERRRA